MPSLDCERNCKNHLYILNNVWAFTCNLYILYITVHDFLYIYFVKTCLIVIESDRTCVTQVSTNPVYIIRSSAAKLGCGSKSQPWKIEAPAGQQISVSLLDFASPMLRSDSDNGQRVSENNYGYIVERLSHLKNISIERRQTERTQLVHVSSSNVLEIVLSPSVHNDDDQPNFLLGFKGWFFLTSNCI